MMNIDSRIWSFNLLLRVFTFGIADCLIYLSLIRRGKNAEYIREYCQDHKLCRLCFR